VFLAIFWIFTYKKVPETKNKTFEEILALFRHNNGRYVSLHSPIPQLKFCTQIMAICRIVLQPITITRDSATNTRNVNHKLEKTDTESLNPRLPLLGSLLCG